MAITREFEDTFALVVENTNSSHYTRVRKQIAGLQAAGLACEFVETSLDQHEMVDKMAEQVRDNTIIFSNGGDGTANLIGSAILSAEGRQAGLHDHAFVPLRGGNANDLAVMLNGRGANPHTILKKGKPVALRPLEITLEDQTKFAFGYFSVGGTAQAAKVIGEMPRKGKLTNLPREIHAALTVTAAHRQFKYRGYRHEPMELATDIMCLNGDRMAKFGRPQAWLSDREFDVIADKADGVLPLALKMAQFGIKSLGGQKTDGLRMVLVEDKGTEKKVTAQYDGEIWTVPCGKEITVTVSRHEYQTLSTRSKQ